MIYHNLEANDLSPDKWDFWSVNQKLKRARLARPIWCLRCQDFRDPVHRDFRPDLSWDSTPCTMWATAQCERKKLQDPLNLVWMCNSRRHAVLHTPIVLLENVVHQPPWLIQDSYPGRPMFWAEVGPDTAGFQCIGRLRALSCLPDEQQCEVRRDPIALYNCISNLLQVRFLTRTSLALRDVSCLEFLAEADMLHRKRFEQPLPEHLIAEAINSGLDSIDFSVVLLPREECSLQDYADKYHVMTGGFDPYKDPDLIVFLGDNASTHLSWTARSNKLPTARTNTGILWAPFWRRWVSSRTLLGMLGVPQTSEHLKSLSLMPHEACEFQFENLTPAQRRRWAGNGVHAAVAGLFVACTLSSIRFKD